MKLYSLLMIFLYAFYARPVFAAEVPLSLFDVKLGSVFLLKKNGVEIEDDIPERKFTGFKRGVGGGIHYYFQPKHEYKDFAYVENKDNPEAKRFETSFKLYLLPVMAAHDNLAVEERQWEVIAIDWANSVADEKKAYQWAIKVCQTYRAAISMSAEIVNFPNENWYECRFSSQNRELSIGGMGRRTNISLTYSPQVIMAKEADIKKKLEQK